MELFTSLFQNPLVSRLCVGAVCALICIVVSALINKQGVWDASYLLIGAGCVWCGINIMNPSQMFDSVISIVGLGVFGFLILVQFIIQGYCASKK